MADFRSWSMNMESKESTAPQRDFMIRQNPKKVALTSSGWWNVRVSGSGSGFGFWVEIRFVVAHSFIIKLRISAHNSKPFYCLIISKLVYSISCKDQEYGMPIICDCNRFLCSSYIGILAARLSSEHVQFCNRAEIGISAFKSVTDLVKHREV
ncbi:hypothetical protein O6H91_11G032600 [Diphasiastrum complanatum]|uniref:Uncharacterized protein n=1 Tax=Diphasiastrum complanatum TaxID=34168 RepID=A0ACC2C7P5_DIPCM|nr:hypothetical protein O6H91_11G032600 [Diphasiastrum complanatum]